jgi:hypothetical protein
MTDAFSIGMMGTDVLTGRTPIALATIPANLAAGAGVCFRRAGADYQVPANTTLYITGYLMTSTAVSSLTNFEIRYADDAALTTNPVTIVPALLCPPATGYVSPVISVGRVFAPTGHYVGTWNPGVNQNASNISTVIFWYEQV